jgi:capsular exopolysaccharide synthesis family protein
VIRYLCPFCGQRLTAEDVTAGAAQRCPSCGQAHRVPAADEAAALERGPAAGAAARPARFTVACQHCGRVLSARAEDVGRRRLCPDCGQAFVVRSATGEPSPSAPTKAVERPATASARNADQAEHVPVEPPPTSSPAAEAERSAETALPQTPPTFVSRSIVEPATTPMDEFHSGTPPHGEHHAGPSLVAGLRRRWRLAAVSAAGIAAVGLAILWLATKPKYEAFGDIEIVPVLPRILVDDESRRLDAYQDYMNTQARLITTPRILDPVLSDTGPIRKLEWLNKVPASERRAFLQDRVEAQVLRGTQLVRVTVTSEDAAAAAVVAQTVVRIYMDLEGKSEETADNERLRILEQELKSAQSRMADQYALLHSTATDTSTASIVPSEREKVMLAAVQALQESQARFKAERIALEAQLQMQESRAPTTTAPADFARLRGEYVRADPVAGFLTTRMADVESQLLLAPLKWESEMAARIAKLEQEYAEAATVLTPEAPGLIARRATIDALKKELDAGRQDAAARSERAPETATLRQTLAALRDQFAKRQAELERRFDEMMTRELAQQRTRTLEELRDRLAQLRAQEQGITDALEQQNENTIRFAQAGLARKKAEDDVTLTSGLVQTLRQRIQNLTLERRRPMARVRVPYEVQVPEAPTNDKRSKMSIVLLIGAVLGGCALAIFVDRMKMRVEGPAEAETRFGLRVLGTTPRLEDLRRGRIDRRHLLDDCRTIWVNLMLAGANGRPRALVVASPEGRDGKTELAIALAAAVARSGKRVLLVDGDLRKPDVARYLRLEHTLGLGDVLASRCTLLEAIRPTPIETLDILPSQARGEKESELLANGRLAGVLASLKTRYDEIIVDTPAVLAVPDAKLWATLCDAVIFVARSGKSGGKELIEAHARMKQTGARVLGLVLTGVSPRDSYDRYYYRYGYGTDGGPRQREESSAAALLTADGGKDENDKPDARPKKT